MPFFGQEIFLKAQEKGPLTTPAYREALEKCRTAVPRGRPRRGPRPAPAGRARRPDRRPGLGHRPRERRPLRGRQLDARRGVRLPQHHRADGLRLRPAGGSLVHRPGLERGRRSSASPSPSSRRRSTAARRGSCAPPTLALKPTTAATGVDRPVSGTGRALAPFTGAGRRVPLLTSEGMIGQAVKHYQVEELLGQGGMGVVYKARDTRLGRPVALKVLPPEFTRDQDSKGRFLREARAASRGHPPRDRPDLRRGRGARGPLHRHGARRGQDGEGPHPGPRARPPRRPRDRPARSGAASRRPTRRASSTATSSPRTSWSPPTATPRSSTSASPSCSSRRRRRRPTASRTWRRSRRPRPASSSGRCAT